MPYMSGILLIITALFWPGEEKEALILSNTAELGKGGGEDQAKMQLLGQQWTKKVHAVKG